MWELFSLAGYINPGSDWVGGLCLHPHRHHEVQTKQGTKQRGHHYRSSPSALSSIKQNKETEPCLSESQASAAPRRRNRTSSDDSLPAAPAPSLQGQAPTTHRVLKTGHPFNQHRHSFRKKKWHPRRLLWILCCTVSWINDRSFFLLLLDHY